MRKQLIAWILLIGGLMMVVADSVPGMASSVTATASSPETLVVSISTNDYSSGSPAGAPAAVPGAVSFGAFVGEERAINDAIKVNVKANGQWSMQIQATRMGSTIPGEEHLVLPDEQYVRRVAVAIGSDTTPTINGGNHVFRSFAYDGEGQPISEAVIENASATGDTNGTQVNIGLKAMLTYADAAREYSSTILVTTTAAY